MTTLGRMNAEVSMETYMSLLVVSMNTRGQLMYAGIITSILMSNAAPKLGNKASSVGYNVKYIYDIIGFYSNNQGKIHD